jgi:ComF family protein
MTAVAYEGTGAQLLRRFKFDGRGDALEVLLDPFARRLRALAFDGVVAVPRHPRRVRELGRDPVHALARALARRLGARLQANVLWRNRATAPQTGLGLSERRENVRGSFSARRGALRGQRVLLVDDVTTTGATLAEAAAALRPARPRELLLGALAATPTHLRRRGV